MTAPAASTMHALGEAENEIHVVLDHQHGEIGGQPASASMRGVSLCGTPAAGSSSSSTLGCSAKAMAISSRRCWP
jgi:hypothetical protein